MTDRDPFRPHLSRNQATVDIREKRAWSIPPEVRVADLSVKKWQIIAGIITIVGGGLTTCTTTVISIATSMRPKENSARIDEMSKKLDKALVAIEEVRAEYRLQGASGLTPRLGTVENQIEYLAGFTRAMNGGPPRYDYPKPLEGEWTQEVSKQKPSPMRVRTDKVWPKSPAEVEQ